MKHHPLHSVFLAVTAALLTAGCASFRKTQSDAFIDGNGNILQVHLQDGLSDERQGI